MIRTLSLPLEAWSKSFESFCKSPGVHVRPLGSRVGTRLRTEADDWSNRDLSWSGEGWLANRLFSILSKRLSRSRSPRMQDKESCGSNGFGSLRFLESSCREDSSAVSVLLVSDDFRSEIRLFRSFFKSLKRLLSCADNFSWSVTCSANSRRGVNGSTCIDGSERDSASSRGSFGFGFRFRFGFGK